ncbi:hypothetical protein HMPREF1986_02405 [Oribacterium sp. oral taxon 078 str. F0263]|nr:hypothetical protein HMPREF1986_02405 [Oribacterium sp. oral taxon 078 str. F0263]
MRCGLRHCPVHSEWKGNFGMKYDFGIKGNSDKMSMERGEREDG